MRLLRWAPDGAYLLTAPQGQAGFSLWSTRDWSQVPHHITENTILKLFSFLEVGRMRGIEIACMCNSMVHLQSARANMAH